MLKIIPFLKKQFKCSDVRKQIAIGLILSMVISSIIVIGYVIHSKIPAIWSALCVVQIGVALLWWLLRIGLFSTSRYAMKNVANLSWKKRMKKHESKDSKLFLREESPISLENKEKSKSKSGIYTMLIIGMIYTIIALILTFI